MRGDREMSSEENVVRRIPFPQIPESESEEMKAYLRQLQITIERASKGSLLLEPIFETGIIGN